MKSLQPSDDPNYVLIHKNALLINTFVIARLSQLLSKHLDASATDIAEEVGNIARDKVNRQSKKQINAEVQTILDSLGDDSGIIVMKYP